MISVNELAPVKTKQVYEKDRFKCNRDKLFVHVALRIHPT